MYRLDDDEAAETGDASSFISIGDDFYVDLPDMDELAHVAFESSEANNSRGRLSCLWAPEDWLDPDLAGGEHTDEES